MDKACSDLIKLIGFTLHETTPHGMQDVDWEQVISLAEAHSVTTLAAASMSYLEDSIPSDLYKAVQDRAAKLIWKLSLMDAERENVLSFLEENGIWYMPLKGAVMQTLYPSPELREMCDSDILYDVTRQDTLVKHLVEEGYTISSINEDAADCFLKPPCYNFEMHRMLFEPLCDQRWQDYYGDVQTRLVKDHGNQFGYHFSDEDFYIYMMLHAYKHHVNNGTGIRSLIDCYIYQTQKGNILDWGYIEQEEAVLGFLDFEETVRTLCFRLFANPGASIELTESENTLLNHCIRSSTYGSLERGVENRIEKSGSKLLYLWNRLFPTMEWYRLFAPFIYQHKYLIPIYIPYRMIKGITIKRKKMQHELSIFMKYK